VNIFHLFANKGSYGIHFRFGDFKNQFVVDLQKHAGFQVACSQFAVDADRGQLDQIGGRSLQGRIHGRALGETAHVEVLAVDVGNRTDPSEERLHVPIPARFFHGAIEISAHALVFVEVGFNELFGLALLDLKSLLQAKSRKPINNSEIDDLRPPPVFRVNHQRRHTEYLRCGQGMNVIAATECFHQQRIFREVR